MPKKWTVLRLRDWANGKVDDDYGDPFLAVYDVRKPTIILWDGGPQYRTVEPDRLRIEKVYSFPIEGGYERAWLNFYLDFRKLTPQPESAPEQSPGWISPSGEFHTCQYCSHGAKAREIAAIVYRTLNGDKHLESRGWLRNEDDGMLLASGWGNRR